MLLSGATMCEQVPLVGYFKEEESLFCWYLGSDVFKELRSWLLNPKSFTKIVH